MGRVFREVWSIPGIHMQEWVLSFISWDKHSPFNTLGRTYVLNISSSGKLAVLITKAFEDVLVWWLQGGCAIHLTEGS